MSLATETRAMDAAGVTIERPTMRDADAIVELWVALAAGQRDYDSHLTAAPNRDRIRESITRQIALSELQVARTEDRHVGFVMYAIEGSTFDRTATRGVIQNLYVVPDHRGRGIGSRLLEAAEADLRADGADVVGLEVMADNEAAQRFYARHGYEDHRVTLEKSVENDTL